MSKSKEKYYIHYGDWKFRPEDFHLAENNYFGGTQPIYGGLYASPSDAKMRWNKWLRENDYHPLYRGGFKFTLKPETRLLHIESMKDVHDIRHANCLMIKGKTLESATWDWESFAEEYDAVELVISKDDELRKLLWDWEVDTLLVLNSNCVEVIA